MEIRYNIVRDVAFAAGKAAYGPATVQVTDSLLAALTIEERRWLPNLASLAPFNLDTPVYDEAALVRAVRAQVAAQETAAQKFVDLSPTEAEATAEYTWPNVPAGTRLHQAIVDRTAAIKQHKAARDAERKAADEKAAIERQAARAKAAAEQEIAAKEDAARMRAYVIAHVPEYRRAAEEGRRVNAQAIAHAWGVIRSTLATHTELGGASAMRVEEFRVERLEAPKAFTYKTRDRIAEVLATLTLPWKATPTVDIWRIDTCPETGCESGWRAAVRVTVSWLTEKEEWMYFWADPGPVHMPHDNGE